MAVPTKEQLEELRELLKQSGTSVKELDDFMKLVENSSSDLVKILIKQNEERQKGNDLIRETNRLAELENSKNARISEDAKKIADERKKFTDDLIKKQNDLLLINQKIKTLEEQQKNNNGILTKEQQNQLNAAKAEIPIIKEQIAASQRNLEISDKRVEVLGQEQRIHKEIINSIEIQTSRMFALDDVWRNYKRGVSLTSALFQKFVDNAAELLSKVNEGNAQFAKTTGQIADRTFNFGMGLSQFGIGFEELNKAAGELFVSMSGFSNLNKNVQKDLAESAAKMELLGVSASTTGKIINDLTKGMRMTADEARTTNEYLARAAIGMGVPPQKMAQEFAAATPKMAAFGKQGVEVFIQLQKQAKSLGMEMNTLMGIVGDTFDTFEGGARAAGRLNAILGGDYLNSVEMLNATESERIEILKRSFDMSGKNFDSLDKYEKKAIAASLGISDLNEASKLFGSSTSDLNADMEKQAATQEKLEAVQKEAVTTQKKMNEIFNGFLVIIKPLVSTIETLVEWITWLNDKAFGFGGTLIGVGLGIKFFGGNITSLLSPLKSMYGFIASMPARIKAMTAAMKAPEGGGFLSGVNAFFKGKTPEVPVVPKIPEMDPKAGFSFKSAMEGMAQGFAAFGNTAGVLKGALIFTLVAAAVGASMIVFAFALKQFTGIDFEQVMKGLGVLTLLTIGMFALGAFLTGPGLIFFGAGVLGIMGLSIAIAALGNSLQTLDVTKLEAFTTFTDKVSAIKDIKEGANQTAAAILTIGLALRAIPEGKDVTLRALNDTLYTAKTIKEEEIKPAKDFVDAVREYYVAQEKSKDSDKDALAVALKELKGILTPKTNNEPIDIKLVLKDGQVLNGTLTGNLGKLVNGNG